MSAETMSQGSAIGATIAAPVSSGMEQAASAWGIQATDSKTNLGGTHIPGLGKDMLSETFQMPTPLSKPDEGGKSIPGISPFENTKVIWEASPKITSQDNSVQIDKVLSNIAENPTIKPIGDMAQSNQPVISKSPNTGTQDSNINSNYIVDIQKPSGNLKTEDSLIIGPIENKNIESKVATTQVLEEIDENKNEVSIPSPIEMQEIKADIAQATKTESALMEIGQTKEEAHKTTMTELSKIMEKKGLTEKMQEVMEDEKKKEKIIKMELDQPVFEHDENADKERKEVATQAIDHAAKKAFENGKQEITGYELAKEMPEAPQPDSVKSEIVKKSIDGSYEDLIKEIKKAGNISSKNEALEIVHSAIDNNHAVKQAQIQSSIQATEKEVRKVLRNGTLLQNDSPIG